jgi:tetratricopeptide (TPR) repeat protein
MNQSESPAEILKRASAMFDQDDFKNAAQLYEQYLTLVYPENQDVHYNLGICYEELGEREKAISHFERYMAMSPNAADAEEVKDWISELKSNHIETMDDGTVEKVQYCPKCRVEYRTDSNICSVCGEQLFVVSLPFEKSRNNESNQNKNEMVKLCEVSGSLEADEIIALLRSCEIPSIATGGSTATISGFLIDSLSAVPIYVPKKFEQAAREIISKRY